MANDVISLIVRLNLALAAGVLVVLLLRPLARRWFGARVAYSLWFLPLLAAAACFLPARIELLTLEAPSETVSWRADAPHAALPHLPPAFWLMLWSAGCVLSFVILALRQGRFSRALGRLRPRADLGDGVFSAESSAHGPAVIGVLRPIIVTPADFDQRFSDEERRIVLAHERAHMAQGDPLINALAVALQCANWFNPFVHIGARALRLDQELAADAAVLATAARRPIAEAILKTQIAAAAPLGAAWPPSSVHSLKERIAMLKRNLPSQTQRLIGVSAIALVSLGACAVAWSAQPAHVVFSKAPNIARADAAPFIEPPLTDRSMLAGAPQTEEEQRAEVAYEKADMSGADSADDESEQSGDAADDDEADILSDEDRAEIASASRLSPEERAQVQAEIRQALAEGRAALAQARRAASEAEAQPVEAAMAVHEASSPRMQAEIRAITSAAVRMARETRMSVAEHDAMRAEIRAHAERLRELAHRSCEHARTEAEVRHGADQQND